MDNFIWETFTKKIAIKATIPKLYDAWTVPQEIEKWFLSKAQFYRPTGEIVQKENNTTSNDSYQWSWFLYDITEKGKIIEANGTDMLQFTFAGDCIVTIKLTQNEDDTIVTLTQSNIPTDNESKRGTRIGCDTGWSFFLVNLKSIYEGGLDLRNKNESLKGMLNC